MTVVIRKFGKWFYLSFAIAAIVLAVIVQAGRSFSHKISDYPEQIGEYLGKRFNANVSIGALSAEWDGLKPMLDVRQLRITSKSNQPIFALEHVVMRLDLLDSILNGHLVWNNLVVQQAHIDFAQTSEGYWHIVGLPRSQEKDKQPAKLDSLVDMLLLSREIEIDKSYFSFQFASGDKTVLEAPHVRVENDKGYHRLSLQVDVDQHPKSLTLVVEAQGDPRKKNRFSSDAYLQLNEFPTNEPIAAASALLLNGINAEIHSEGTINAKLWFKSRPGQDGFEVVGHAGVERLNLPIAGRKLILDSFTTELVGQGLSGGKWQLGLQNINTRVNDHLINNVNFAVSTTGLGEPVVLHMQNINLSHLNQALDNAGLLGEKRLREIMRTLNPQGELRNIEVSIPTEQPVDWQLKANLHQVATSAWQGVPALSNVDGYVQAGQKGGHVDIDSRQGFSMHFSPVYANAMQFDQATGQVAWWLQPDNNQVYVNSGALEFVKGDEKAKGYMWLALPWKHGTGDVDLYLHIGATQLGASQYSKFVPSVLPKSLLTWLSESIGEQNPGYASEGGFIYRSTISSHNPAAHSHQLYLDIHNATLNYHPEWPALQALNGRLLLDDETLLASVDNATLFASEVGSTQISVAPNPEGEGSLLKVDGTVTGSAADGLRVLRETMLRQYVGSNTDSWTLDGSLKTHVDIAVPLKQHAPGAKQNINIDLLASAFSIGNLKLDMRTISGHINFSHDTGLTSRDLTGQLFGEPVQVLLGTKKQGDASQTFIDVQGEVASKALAQWSQRPEVLFLNGKIPYVAHVELNHRGPADNATKSSTDPFALIIVTSQLAGVGIDLPAPYGKAANVERPLIYSMALREHSSLIDVRYSDNLQALIEVDPKNNSLRNANIDLGGEAALRKDPQFLLSGKLPSLDIEPWKKIQQKYLGYTATLKANGEPKAPVETTDSDTFLAGLPFRAAVMVDHYDVGPLKLQNIDVRATRLRDAWTVQFSNPIVVGDVYLPNDNRKPLQINLQELHLPRDMTQANAESTLGPRQPENSVPAENITAPGIDPRSLPLADVSVRQLYFDEKNYGSWSLQIRPNQAGVVFDNIRGTVRDITVNGVKDSPVGAKLQWQVNEQGAQTHFTGVLSAVNLSTVLQAWQKPDMIESAAASFNTDIRWQGDPQDFNLKKLSGSIDIAIENGRFKRSPSVSSDGFLRLLSILNFDSLARRLRLDFSDLYKSGLAYDHITGKVDFEPGTMTFAEPLIVQTPSSRLQMAGKLDLNREKINTRLVATLPVASNLTFVAALAAGLPAAAGIYLVSKLFKKQVDQATSVSYRITGGWDDPNMSFDRLFESEDSLRESVATSLEKTKSVTAKPVPTKPVDTESVEVEPATLETGTVKPATKVDD